MNRTRMNLHSFSLRGFLIVLYYRIESVAYEVGNAVLLVSLPCFQSLSLEFKKKQFYELKTERFYEKKFWKT